MKRIIITGMHRSGTSMVTGVLARCGLYVGDNLLGPMRENPKGFYEDKDFLKLNKDILKYSGGSWRDVPREIKYDPVIGKRMREFIQKWDPEEIVGWKDPRCCLTLPLWKKVLPVELGVIFVYRDKENIIKSLEKRNKMTAREAGKLYDQYMFHFLSAMQYKPKNRVYVFYDDFFIDWRYELERIFSTLKLPLKIPGDTTDIEQFIDKKLRHYKGGKSG